ncbi:hypothetical protein TRVL_05529 [Trypanosoma vivax]|nr:hypothetical protein TRVL_05529 [Trypanosoma vivax]
MLGAHSLVSMNLIRRSFLPLNIPPLSTFSCLNAAFFHVCSVFAVPLTSITLCPAFYFVLVSIPVPVLSPSFFASTASCASPPPFSSRTFVAPISFQTVFLSRRHERMLVPLRPLSSSTSDCAFTTLSLSHATVPHVTTISASTCYHATNLRLV